MIAVRSGDELRLPDALKCLYLDEIPEQERVSKGAEIAGKLFDVLDKAGVKLDRIPEKPDGRSIAVELGGDASQKIIVRQYDDNLWRFSYNQTLSSVATLQEAIQDEAESPAAQAELEPLLKSPRDTMAAFISGMNTWRQGGMAKAIGALNLSHVSKNVRMQTGRELAVKLKRVLDRDRRVQIADVPNYSEGEPYVHLLAPSGSVVIERVSDPETGVDAWKFSAKTMENLASLYDAFKDRPLAEGILRDMTPTLLSMTMRDAIDRQAPFLLERSFYLENWQWLGMIAAVVVGMAFSRLMAFCLAALVCRAFSRHGQQLDSELERGFKRPIRIVFMAWVWLMALSLLGLPTRTYVLLYAGAQTVTVIAIVIAMFRLADIVQAYLLARATRDQSRFDDLLVPLLVRTFKLAFIVVGCVFVADALDIDYMSLLTGLGLGGLALALAAKDTLGNIFGSLTILLDRSFQIGDWIKIKDIEGTVESVGMRSTRIRTFYNSLVSVPNSELITATLDNYGARQFRRIRTMISVSLDTPPEKIQAFCEGIRHLIASHEFTRKEEYYVYFNEIGPHSLDILLYCFLEVRLWATELRERERLFLDIIHLAKRLDIEFAYPTQTLYVRPDAKNGNGGAASFGEREAIKIGRTYAQDILARHNIED